MIHHKCTTTTDTIIEQELCSFKYVYIYIYGGVKERDSFTAWITTTRTQTVTVHQTLREREDSKKNRDAWTGERVKDQKTDANNFTDFVPND